MPSESTPNSDLPGDAAFRAINGGEVIFPDGSIAMLQTVSAIEQANIHHNKLRYAELQRLRLGQPNLYNESRYRH